MYISQIYRHISHCAHDAGFQSMVSLYGRWALLCPNPAKEKPMGTSASKIWQRNGSLLLGRAFIISLPLLQSSRFCGAARCARRNGIKVVQMTESSPTTSGGHWSFNTKFMPKPKVITWRMMPFKMALAAKRSVPGQRYKNQAPQANMKTLWTAPGLYPMKSQGSKWPQNAFTMHIPQLTSPA